MKWEMIMIMIVEEILEVVCEDLEFWVRGNSSQSTDKKLSNTFFSSH